MLASLHVSNPSDVLGSMLERSADMEAESR